MGGGEDMEVVKGLAGELRELGFVGLAVSASGGSDEGFVDEVCPVREDGGLVRFRALSGEHRELGERLHGAVSTAFHEKFRFYGTGASVHDAFSVSLDGMDGGTVEFQHADTLEDAARSLCAPAAPRP